MSKACNNIWNNKKGKSYLQTTHFHNSVFYFEKTSYHSIWKALYETRPMLQNVLCALLFLAEKQLWMLLLNYLFMEIYLLHFYIKEEKPNTLIVISFFLMETNRWTVILWENKTVQAYKPIESRWLQKTHIIILFLAGHKTGWILHDEDVI